MLDPSAEEEEPQHVEEQVAEAAVQEHVREDRPGPRDDLARDEDEERREPRDEDLQTEDGDVRDDEALHPGRHLRNLAT